MPSVLFLCTENAARSQMAEALLRQRGGDRFEVFSAGTRPTRVDPRTIEALRAFGIEVGDPQAKALASLGDRRFDYVITLCSKAREECRTWPDYGVAVAWDFEDPAASADPQAFMKTLQAIDQRVRLFIEVHSGGRSGIHQVPDAVTFFKALADETRLRCLLLISRLQECCVCELVEALSLPQPTVSRHLALLRKSGLLLDRRQGQWVHYRLHPGLPGWMGDVLRTTLDRDPHHAAVVLALSAQILAQRGREAGPCVTEVAS